MRAVFMLLLFLSSVISVHSQVICIDPGHGYGPNGENFDKRTQEEILTNCAVGLKLRDLLESMGYSVIMTRTHSDSGSWMSLAQRTELADAYDSDRLLSIHCNGGGGTGTETFWCYRNTPNQTIDSTFSRIVQDYMAETGQWRSRRSTEDFPYLGFHLGILQGYTPGCLNEIGFVDTPADLEKLLDDNWRNVFADAYAEAIVESFNRDYNSLIIFDNKTPILYPNPVNDILNINLGITVSVTMSIKIFNSSGTLILIMPAKNIIDVSWLNRGIYFLHITYDDIINCYKFIKVK
ncbi:MAG: N-acetylmuramoyl-L-alanine amidase [Bacteroidales bacterium]